MSPDPYVALRRVRSLAAGALLVDWATSEGSSSPGDPRTRVVLLGLLAVVLVNTLSRRAGGHRIAGVRPALLEPLVDSAWTLAVCVVPAESADAPWFVLAVPVVGAVVHGHLSRALLTWGGVAAGYVAGRLVHVRGGPGGAPPLAELGDMVEQMAVILLVAVPSGYLTEQLVVRTRHQARATAIADHRGRMLERVAEVGSALSQLGSDPAALLCRGVRDLGFERAEVVRLRHGSWHADARVPDGDWVLPAPNPAATDRMVVEAVDLGGRTEPAEEPGSPGELVTVPLDPSPRHPAYLVAARQPVGGEDPATARAAAADQLEALGLLARQAAVALRNTELVGELRRLHADLQHQATHDALTGLPNRAFLRSAVERRIDGAGSRPDRAALLFLDLDGFKPVNDSLGHEAGDRLLCTIADRLRSSTGARDVVARLGGDEFTVLLDSATPGSAMATAGRLVQAVSEPVELDGGTVRVGVSIGVALGDPGVDSRELMRRADVAMYAAKAAGRGRVRAWNAGLDAPEGRVEHGMAGAGR